MKNLSLSIPVIFNPNAGKKRAARRLRQMQKQSGLEFELRSTEKPGDAEELALRAASEGQEIIAAAGGDGTIHEVANGILRAGSANAALAILPLGSANDYYYSLQKQESAGESPECLVDVGVVREPKGKERYFVCCLGLGLNSAVTREARKIRRLQGFALYGWATLRALWLHYDCPEMTIAIDDEPPMSKPTLLMSIMVGRREGGFVMAPGASLTDGLFDYVHGGQLSRWRVARLLPRVALFGVPKSYPQVIQGQCRRLVLKSPMPLTVHVDGEFFCVAEDNVCELEIEMLPAKLRVLTEVTDAVLRAKQT